MKSEPEGLATNLSNTSGNIFACLCGNKQTACYDKGASTENVRSANIRLILKKNVGTDKLNKWRPTSLLNYSIFINVFHVHLKID